MVFFSWVTLFDHLRYYKGFRTMVIFFEKSLKALPFFLSGLIIILAALISSFYWQGAIVSQKF